MAMRGMAIVGMAMRGMARRGREEECLEKRRQRGRLDEQNGAMGPTKTWHQGGSLRYRAMLSRSEGSNRKRA
eukprot:4888812-Pleurochrysis_carterae.AAC.1